MIHKHADNNRAALDTLRAEATERLAKGDFRWAQYLKELEAVPTADGWPERAIWPVPPDHPTYVEPPGASAVMLEAAKAAYKAKVDEAAEAYRLKFISPGDGMQMTYREKFEQAQAVHAMGEAEANALSEAQRLAQFPTLAASIGLEGPSLWAVAQLVLQKYAEFAQLSYAIESRRLGTKKAIAAATSEAEIKAIYDGITWP